MLRRHLLLLLFGAAWVHAGGPPQRIVSLSPQVTEILAGLDVFPRVVAVSNYCTWPAAVQKLPRLGGWQDPSLEKIVALRPDLVIIGESQAPFMQSKLEDLRIPLLITPGRNVADISRSITMIGKAVQAEAQAARLNQNIQNTLDQVRRRVAGHPRLKVLIVVDRTPGTLRDLYTATPGSFLADLIDIAGGQVIAEPAPSGYSKISKERVVALNPDVILDFIHGAKGRFAGNPLEAWADLPDLAAVKTKRVYSVSEDYVPHASQRITLTAELFARLIHPETQARSAAGRPSK